MTKESALENFKSVKDAHIVWIERAKRLINGAEVTDTIKPVTGLEEKFSQWLYGDGEVLKGLSNNPLECMQNIEKLHKEFHELYLDIFTLYFTNQQSSKGFFSKIFSSKEEEIKESDGDVAKQNCKKMQKMSEELTNELDRLQRRLEAVSDEKIRALT